MKNFIKFILKLIYSTFKKIIMFILSTLLMIALIFYVVNTLISEKMNNIMPEKSLVVKENSFLELSFPNGLTEKSRGNKQLMELLNESQLTLYSVIKSIENAKTDDKISGIYIDLDKIKLSGAHTEEIINKLQEFQSTGKKVYAFGNSIHTGNIRFAMIADEAVMTPSHSTNLHLTGYSYSTPYFKPLLDNIGINFQVVHTGDYKTYGEHLVLDEMSSERKEEIVRIYDKRYSNLGEFIGNRLDISGELITNEIYNGVFARNDSFDAKEFGIVDSLEYFDNFINKRNLKNRISITKYSNTIKVKLNQNKIALIYAEGNIIYGSPANPSDNVISPEVMTEEIDRAMNDENIKGIVIRVNSPGGVALSAEIITQKILEAKTKKPIYVSMGSTAASGGYYIASNADKIFADEATITGSIGVVGLIFNVNELFENLSINMESITKGKYSDMFSLQRPLNEEELELMVKSQQNIYEEFKQRVIDGRAIDSSSLEEISQGKIWLGDEASNNGLVDEIGGLDTTIKQLASRLSLTEYQVIEVVKPIDAFEFITKFAERMSGGLLSSKLNKIDSELKFIKSINKQPTTLYPYNIEIE